MTENCILSDRHKNGCSDCPPTCAHRIAMHGMNGKGGRIAAAGAPSDYRNLTLKNSPARESQVKAYRIFDAYVSTFSRMFNADGDQIKSLYLFSESPGTGKTTSAVAVMNEYIMTNYLGSLKNGKQPPQQPAYFLDVNEWQTLYNGFNRANIPQDVAEQYSRPYYAMMEKAKSAPFAVLDDIGVRTASDAFRADLHTIINYRCANALPTVYTSNIPLEELATVFDKRLYDRVRDQCGVIAFEGGSKRGRR